MKNTRTPSLVATTLLLAGCVLTCSTASAGSQWKWRDATGAIQYSDRAPPPGTPEQNILAKPSAAKLPTKGPDLAASAAALVTAAPSSKASDPELELRRQKAEDDKLAQKKADEEKAAKQRADNCQRARGYQRSLKEGMRIARTNAKGEREILDDKARADESARTQEVVQSNCK
ncbi:MAG: DUF4124 domain-containing protein [Aquabacterium sp.]|nr:DUF4124 domain-containing protein [Aquabacterium sp.]